MEILMHQCMAGLLNLQNVPRNYMTEMGRLADQKMQDIVARMEELQKIGAVNSQMGGNQVQNFPLVNSSLQAGFGWGNVPYGFRNTGPSGPNFSTPPGNTNAGTSSNPTWGNMLYGYNHTAAPGPSFSTTPGNTDAGTSSNPPENDAPGPSFRN
ncbi:Uncharacterized protein Fot_24615 [Forsythia ovata]|uniref:Uncharacterized protein n=1 Tax=Forsythia ovata TaxID=205694 RepID=A0ABD1U6R4_9LAMI